MKLTQLRASNIISRKAQKLSSAWAQQYWHLAPFGTAPQADPETYLKLWEEAKDKQYPQIDAYEQGTASAIDKEWLDDLALQTQIVIKSSPLCYQHGRVLYSALREYLSQNKEDNLTIFETGTARGFSSVVMAKALDDAGRNAKILTLDLLPHHKPLYWNCIADHKGKNTREQLLQEWKNLVQKYIIFVEGDSDLTLPKLGFGRIHFAFLDGAHTYKSVWHEFKSIAPYQNVGDIIVFDDYSPSIFPGLVKAVDEGCEQLGYKKTVIQSDDVRAYVIAEKL